MVFSNHGAASFIAGCLVLCFSLEATATIPGPCALNSDLVLVCTGTPIPVTDVPMNGSLCGDFAVHAATAITMAPGNQITGGHVGVFVPTFSLPGDVNSYLDADTSVQPPRNAAATIPIEMGGVTYIGGAYFSGTLNIAAGANATLKGSANTQFVFYSGTTMVTGIDSEIVLDGVNAKNVFWVVGTALTTGTGSKIKGSIVSGTAMNFGTSTEVEGCLAAGTAITFGTKALVTSDCVAVPGTVAGGSICAEATV